jgi:hypothetical protein
MAEVISGDDKVVAHQGRHLLGKASGVEVEYDLVARSDYSRGPGHP